MSQRKSNTPPPRADATRIYGSGPRSKTPALGSRVQSVRPPPAALDWRGRAQLLAAAIDEVSRGEGRPEQIARVERAWAAWHIDLPNDAVIARVAHLVERAYAALHESARPNEQALMGCAHILYNGLPRAVRGGIDFPQVQELVKKLRSEKDPIRAIVLGATDLLGWQELGYQHVSKIVRLALATRPEPER